MEPGTVPWHERAWKYRHLLRNLIAKDFKVRYQGSFLGFLWTLVAPLVLILIYIIAFQYILRIQIPNFALFLLSGILPWTFFSAAVIASTDSLTSNASLIKNIAFPRETLPIATVLFQFSHLLLAFVVFFPAVVFLDAPFSPALIALPFVLFINLVIALGLALLVSACTVFFIDIRQIVDLGMMALFWLTPIIYDISMIPHRLQVVLFFGPMTSVVNGYQDILYWGQWPSPDTWIVGSAWAVGASVVGALCFRWLNPKLAEAL